MSTKRETIMAALVAELAGTVGVGSRIYRSRTEALAGDESPALVVMPIQEAGNENAIGSIDAQLTVQVAVYQRGATPDSLADPTVESAFGKIMGSPTLGGLAVDISEAGTTWEFDDGNDEAAWIGMNFVIWYRHNRTTLT